MSVEIPQEIGKLTSFEDLVTYNNLGFFCFSLLGAQFS